MSISNHLYSTSIYISTIPEPTSRPEDVSASPLTHRDLKVCWGPPAFAGQNGRITKYLIKCSGCGQNIYTISSESKCTVITGLTPFSAISVSVSAENVAGSGPYSTPVSTVMKVDSESDSINGTREHYMHTPPHVHAHTSTCTCTHLHMYMYTPPRVSSLILFQGMLDVHVIQCQSSCCSMTLLVRYVYVDENMGLM